MKTQQEHFDEVGCQYDDSIAPHIIAHLTGRRTALAESLLDEGRVLDVGCGTGRFLQSLPQRYEKVGIDISSAMLNQARNKGLDVVEGKAESLPFEDNSFDLVTSFAVLHHLIQQESVVAALKEMARVVRSDGVVIVWDHNPLNPYWHLLMARLPQDQGDERLVPARLIVDTLRGAQMHNVSLRRMTFTPDFTPGRMLPVVAHVERVLERVPLLNLLAAHNVAIACA